LLASVLMFSLLSTGHVAALKNSWSMAEKATKTVGVPCVHVDIVLGQGHAVHVAPDDELDR
jgi:hypothetical protein